MRSTSYLLSALALLGLTAAQSSTTSSPCSQKTVTISSQGDASALAASCTTVTGSVVIASPVAGPLNLDGIQSIGGDLTCIGASNLTQLSGNSLTSIGGMLDLERLTIMSTLAFTKLTSVGGIQFITLNAIQQLTFTSVISKAKSVLITDTALFSLDGINLQTVDSFQVTNNLALRTISTQVANATQQIIISANGLQANVSFPNLMWAANMTLINVSSISIPSLSGINGTFGLYSSYMSSVLAPNLTTIGADLALVALSSVTNLSFPVLTKVGGGFLIANNSQLLNITGFNALQSTGALSVSGNYTEFDLPALKDVAGSFNAQSSGNFSCGPYQSAKNSGLIKGSYVCNAKSNNVQASLVTGSGTATQTGSAASSTSTKSAASISKANPEVFALSALVGGLAILVL